jgi:hypothetical protein
VVGTHFPDDRDLFESALQRMRDAFEGLRDGQLSPGPAEDEFLLGYDTVSDISTAFFLGRPRGKPRTPDDDPVL